MAQARLARYRGRQIQTSNQLPDLLEAAAKGRSTIIISHGRPVAQRIDDQCRHPGDARARFLTRALAAYHFLTIQHLRLDERSRNAVQLARSWPMPIGTIVARQPSFRRASGRLLRPASQSLLPSSATGTEIQIYGIRIMGKNPGARGGTEFPSVLFMTIFQCTHQCTRCYTPSRPA